MAQLFTIDDQGNIVINKLALSNTSGNVTHTGDLVIAGNLFSQRDLSIIGKITADTLEVKHLITENGGPSEIGNWIRNTENELIGKGFSWTWGENAVRLSYDIGNRLWTNSNIDLAASKTYKIDNVDVVGYDYLGPQLTKSNLKQVGSLKSLTVLGNATLGEFAFFDSGLGRVGINTDQPNGALSVTENNVEFIIASPNYGVASIGTYTNSDVTFISDNTPRFTLKNNGEVIFGSALTNSAVVTINGTLNVTTLNADTRIDRYSPLQFKPSSADSIYGLGLEWVLEKSTKKLVMVSNPDRLYSTESIELALDQSYHINQKSVLSETGLGPSVVHSSLTSVGPLSSLLVSGESTFGEELKANVGITTPTVTLYHDLGSSTLTNNRLDTKNHFSISVNLDTTFFTDANTISLGNKLNNNRVINLYGRVGVGVTNVDPSVGLEVNGGFKFADKKFITGSAAPTQGTFTKGDICWNSNPIPGSYIGWVCIIDGGPGQWAPFGSISQQ